MAPFRSVPHAHSHAFSSSHFISIHITSSHFTSLHLFSPLFSLPLFFSPLPYTSLFSSPLISSPLSSPPVLHTVSCKEYLRHAARLGDTHFHRDALKRLINAILSVGQVYDREKEKQRRKEKDIKDQEDALVTPSHPISSTGEELGSLILYVNSRMMQFTADEENIIDSMRISNIIVYISIQSHRIFFIYHQLHRFNVLEIR